MDKQRLIERILKASNNGQWSASAAFGNAGSMSGRPQILQSDMNTAISSWLRDDDPLAIQQVTTTLHLTGALTDKEYAEIMKAIDGDK